MKKTNIVALHVGYWLLYVFLISFLSVISPTTEVISLPEPDDWAFILLFSLLAGSSSFYVCYGWLVPRYLVSRHVRSFLGIGLLASIGIAVASTLLVSLVMTIIIYIVLQQWQWVLVSEPGQWILLTGFTLLALVNGITGTLLRGAISWYTDIHLKEKMANQTLQGELALLKAQLNPHFLFNTLHNIDVLISHDAGKASAYLNKLSDLLRFNLYETQADQIPLTLELASIEKYIALQRIRTVNERYVSLAVEGDADGLQIAPLLFMPYLENAFKFASNKKVTDAIQVSIKISEERVHFQCVNLIDPNKSGNKMQGGLGLELVRKRLALRYPERHKLVMNVTPATYSVDLTLLLEAYALPVD